MTAHDQEFMFGPGVTPRYRASFPVAMGLFFRRYVVFRGRASRAEFWWPILTIGAVPYVLQLLRGLTTGDWDEVTGDTFATTLDGLVLILTIVTAIPTLAVSWRRLHDIDRTGLWALFGLIPIIGWITMLVFALTPARPGATRFD